MELSYEMYDADNHLYEAADALTRHLPAGRERDLFWVTDERGHRHLILDGQWWDYIPNPTFDPIAKAGCLEEMFSGKRSSMQVMADGMRNVEPLQLRPEYLQRDRRIERMDAQMVRAALMYPTLASGIEEYARENPSLIMDILWGFNLWLQEEWGFAHEQRIFATPMLSLVDPDWAVRMLEWSINHGCRAIYMRPAAVPTAMGYRSPADPIFDPFWARCAEAEILVCIHLGESGYYRQSGDYTGRYRRHAFSLSPFEHVYLHGRAITDFLSAMVLQGAFTRHPRLRLLSVENGSDWFPFFVESCKLYYQRYPADFPEDPIEAIQRNLWISPYWEDPLPELAATLSTSKILAGSDFPHAEGLAEPTDFVKSLKGFNEDDQRMIMHDNLKYLLDV